jgi:hypothetical protein
MKKVAILFATLALSAITAHAQGRIIFASASPSGNQRASLPTEIGTGFVDAASGFVANLAWGTSLGNYTQVENYNVAFGSGGQAGYFFGSTRALTDWVSGPIFGIVQVWNPADGTFAQAQTKPGAAWFEGLEFSVTPSVSPTPAPNIPLGTGTYTLNYNIVPEPSTFALAGLGAAALLIFRRRA